MVGPNCKTGLIKPSHNLRLRKVSIFPFPFPKGAGDIEINVCKVLERSLFTSCYASKKRTSEGSERVTFFLHRNSWIKSLKHFLKYDVFNSYILRISLSDRHISRIGSEQLWKYIVRPIRDTKNSTSRCKSQYVWNKTLCLVVQISLNVVLFFSIFCGTGVSYVFLLLRRNWRETDQNWPPCACATFDRCVLAIKNCSEIFVRALTVNPYRITWPRRKRWLWGT